MRGPSFPAVRDRAGSNVPVPFADPEGGRMALFMVQPETWWPYDRARLMAKAALDRDTRTVKQVIIPVHGATHNDAFGHPLLHRVPRRPVTGVQPVPGLGRCVQQRGPCQAAVQARRTAPPTQPRRIAAQVASLPPFGE